jgi:hypothetical protein
MPFGVRNKERLSEFSRLIQGFAQNDLEKRMFMANLENSRANRMAVQKTLGEFVIPEETVQTDGEFDVNPETGKRFRTESPLSKTVPPNEYEFTRSKINTLSKLIGIGGKEAEAAAKVVSDIKLPERESGSKALRDQLDMLKTQNDIPYKGLEYQRNLKKNERDIAKEIREGKNTDADNEREDKKIAREERKDKEVKIKEIKERLYKLSRRHNDEKEVAETLAGLSEDKKQEYINAYVKEYGVAPKENPPLNAYIRQYREIEKELEELNGKKAEAPKETVNASKQRRKVTY